MVIGPHDRRQTLAVLFFLIASLGYPVLAQAQLVDAIRNLFRDPLIHAIDKGLKPNGDLALELLELENFTLETAAQGEAVLRAVARLSEDPRPQTAAWSSLEFQVLGLFETAQQDSPAYEILWRRGIPQLLEIYQDRRDKLEQAAQAGEPVDQELVDDLVYMLQIFAAYQTREGSDCVSQAALSDFGKDSYYWDSVFYYYQEGHPQADRLFGELSKKLPHGRIAESVLSAANAISWEHADFPHPFDNPAGLLRLKSWLTSQVGAASGVAISAAQALAFLKSPGRDALLEIAHRHPDHSVRIEAASAAAHAGLDVGLQRLATYCLDVHASVSAQTELELMEKADLIPPESREPRFAAKAEMSRWLQEESEYSRAPQELEIIEERKLKWLEQTEPSLIFIIRFRMAGETPLDDDVTGVGVVGGMTWSIQDNVVARLPYDDIFAIHYALEATSRWLLTHVDSSDLPTAEDFSKRWPGQPLSQIQVDSAYVASKSLPQPGSQTIAARAEQNGQAGFAVLDDEHSRWYPAAEFPEEMEADRVLQIHIGRRLLEFPPADQRELRPIVHRQQAPEQIVMLYETLVDDLAQAAPEDQVWQLESSQPLNRHFARYVAAKAEVTGESSSAIFIATYERMLEFSQSVAASEREFAFDSYSLLGDQFEGYADYIAAEHPQKLAELIKTLEPYWNYEFERSRLANVAFKAGLRMQAQRLLEKQYFSQGEQLELADDIRNLAELWAEEGKLEKARQLLTEAIERTETSMTENDMSEYQEELQTELASFSELYQKLFGEAAPSSPAANNR